MPARRIIQRHILILGAIIIVAGFIAASDALNARSEEILEFAERVISNHPLLGKAFFVLLAMVSAMFAFFSSAILVPIGIYAWGAGVCAGLLWIGWLLGGIVAFGIGRQFGRPVAARLIGEARFAALEQRLDGRLRFVHVLLFQLTVPSEFPGYLLGTLHYRFHRYVLSLGLAELPYAIGTVFLGAAFLQRRVTLLLLLGAGAIGLSVVVYRLYRDVVGNPEN